MTDRGELIDRYRGTVVELLVHAAAQWPEQPALICEGETLDYGGYCHSVIGLACRLREAAAPARVAVIMRNGIGACIAHFGVLRQAPSCCR